ncbi:MAG: fumarate hydratase [Oscillospiraceae bacterium]|nr:fumarate hydratase [Oscillospiraceae bacterium]
MRDIDSSDIARLTRRLILQAEFDIPEDVREALMRARSEETSAHAKFALDQIIENQEIAATERTPICQDTGMIVIFAEIGQDAHITGGNFEQAIQDGVRAAFADGYLRASVVDDPLFDRVNTRDNSPGVIHARIVPGEGVRLLVTPKGFGSENMSRVRMLTPSSGVDGVLDFIVDTAKLAGSNPCPPTIIGVGIGGTLEQCALIAKRMTARPLGKPNSDARYAALEAECLRRINSLNIGAAGFGGSCTALAVHIDHAPTHIAGLPVAVNMCCHAARHAEGML